MERIENALVASGASVVTHANPRSAPFELTNQTPIGETLDLVCYAFTANKYRQGGRPADEHRFQVKYGSEFDRYHTLFIDPSRRKVTLMFGVHLELDLFTAVDPRMHTPTWFSSSVEFKTENLEEAKRKHWHGWERERSDARRKVVRPEESLETETAISLRPDQFLRYVEFERVASGLECGERLYLASYGITCSMSRRADCYDNAVMESFFATVKKEKAERFPSYSDAKMASVDYIECSITNGVDTRRWARSVRPGSGAKQRRSLHGGALGGSQGSPRS